jgi:hypothetical protein
MLLLHASCVKNTVYTLLHLILLENPLEHTMGVNFTTSKSHAFKRNRITNKNTIKYIKVTKGTKL